MKGSVAGPSSVRPGAKPSKRSSGSGDRPDASDSTEGHNLSTSVSLAHLPDEVSWVDGAPRFKWWQNLKTNLASLVGLSSPIAATKSKSLSASRTREVRAPVEPVLTDELLAKQWKMRYSEDNITLCSFELSHIVSMVMGMPLMVHVVDSTMAVLRLVPWSLVHFKLKLGSLRYPIWLAGRLFRPS